MIRRILVALLVLVGASCAVCSPSPAATTSPRPAAPTPAARDRGVVPAPRPAAVRRRRRRDAPPDRARRRRRQRHRRVLRRAHRRPGRWRPARPTRPCIGASTQKLLTGAAALAVLGPDSTFTTRVVATGEPANGTRRQPLPRRRRRPAALDRRVPRRASTSDPKTAGTPVDVDRDAGRRRRGEGRPTRERAASSTTPATTTSAYLPRGPRATGPRVRSARSARSP